MVCAPHALDDLEMLSHVYGADLGACDTSRLPSDWLDITHARQLLAEAGLNTEALDVLEVYAGTAGFTAACKSLGLRVGAPIDIKPAIGGKSWDMFATPCSTALVGACCRLQAQVAPFGFSVHVLDIVGTLHASEIATGRRRLPFARARALGSQFAIYALAI